MYHILTQFEGSFQRTIVYQIRYQNNIAFIQQRKDSSISSWTTFDHCLEPCRIETKLTTIHNKSDHTTSDGNRGTVISSILKRFPSLLEGNSKIEENFQKLSTASSLYSNWFQSHTFTIKLFLQNFRFRLVLTWFILRNDKKFPANVSR